MEVIIEKKLPLSTLASEVKIYPQVLKNVRVYDKKEARENPEVVKVIKKVEAEEKRLLKAADRLSALIKCMEEQRSGNHEFDAALRQQREALEGMHCPEADWFMAHCLPCFTQNLDELTRSE